MSVTEKRSYKCTPLATYPENEEGSELNELMCLLLICLLSPSNFLCTYYVSQIALSLSYGRDT